jgi:hypothetical protein
MGLGMEAVRAMAGGAFPLRRVRRADARLLRIERWGVGLLVAVLHLLLVASVQRLLFGRTPSSDEQAMQLVYVDWPPPLPKPKRESEPEAVPPASDSATAARVEESHRVLVSATPAQSAPADAPLELSMPADDAWDATAAQRSAQARDAHAFDRRNPVTRPPPERFPMVDRSPAALVRRIAMGLFWPPGYSDDPCAGVNEAIEAFSRQAASERHRRMLTDAVLQRNRYCPP